MLNFPLILLVPGGHLAKINHASEKVANVCRELSNRATSHADWYGSGKCGCSIVMVVVVVVGI
jgi:hypothetical protein